MIRRYLPLIILLSICTLAEAKGKFEWTNDLKKAYNHALALRFSEANSELARIKLKDPDNLLVYHVENYMDILRVYINEEDEEFERLEPNKDYRLNKIKGGDKDSPYYLYLQANIRLHWALARLKFEEYATAAFEVNKAYKLLIRNQEKFPNFIANKKELGILHSMVGTIPDNYRWIVDLLSSLEGTFEQGKRELEEVIAYSQHTSFIYEQEIYILYAYLLLHLGNDNDGAWEVINTGQLNPSNNLMATFVMANVAMRTDRGSEAIDILNNRPRGNNYHPFPYLDYLLGLAKLQRLDRDANIPLQKFLHAFKGKNFIKDAYQKLSWHHLIIGDINSFNFYRKQCLVKGNKTVGSDKSAYKNAKLAATPDLSLLKARLLFDGGHFQRAYDLLENQCDDDQKDSKYALELTYRKGRILHKLKNYDKALKAYEQTIVSGRSEPWYFACRAALEQGRIYETLRQASKARTAYKNCLSIKPSEHKTALHQQAKAGLSRISNKK